MVIPSYREAARIGATLEEVVSWLSARRGASEVIVVDDGSDDATADVIRPWVERGGSGAFAGVRLERHAVNRGKGAAVRTGLAATSAPWRLMMDADSSTRIGEVEKLLAAAERSGAALIAGSRRAPGAEVTALASRQATGLLFRASLTALGLGMLRDTQCGFKLYRADLADLVTRFGREDRFAFDIEHILLARRAGLVIEEVGVRWEHRAGSTVRPVRDGLRMLRSAAAMRARRDWGAPGHAPGRAPGRAPGDAAENSGGNADGRAAGA